MIATGRGLEDVLEAALTKWPKQNAMFGAAGRLGPGIDEDLISALTASTKSKPSSTSVSPDPMNRMFSTEIGQRAVNIVGNETRTLAVLQRLSVEVIAEDLRNDGLPADERILVMSGIGARPPALMIMDPNLNVDETRVVSEQFDLPLKQLTKAAAMVADPAVATPEGEVVREVLRGGPTALAEVFLIAQPEVVLTRRPLMTPLCVPSPHLGITSGTQTSTAGIFCRDGDGEFGVTGCFHGTGPVGTKVTVELRQSQVKRASEVQDIVFIPLGDGYNVPQLAGVAGVLEDREPARSDQVRFAGVTNPNGQTRIASTDAGLLRARPTMQLKLQTGPHTDRGDSGCALVDVANRVIGFAFERTAHNDFPEFTDWIWAANALRALKLVPHKAGG